MNIGLYFGSFNPIHIGHLIIANTVLQNTELEKIWFIVSPHNPLKDASVLLDENVRLRLTTQAINENEKFEVCDIEFQLPRPSYTINTLKSLTEKYPDFTFSIIMGSDSYNSIHQWKDYKSILHHHKIIIYERPGSTLMLGNNSASIVKGPLLEISSTYIRDSLKSGKSIRYLVPENICKLIESNKYFTKE